MKIISRGTGNQVKCARCLSILEVDESDLYLKKNTHHDYDGDEEDNYQVFVNCAVCKNQIPVGGSYGDSGSRRRLLEIQKRSDHDL